MEIKKSLKLKKISIKLKPEHLKNNKNTCPICSQKMDICVTSHKNSPFIDNKLYPKMCFTCFHVPKINEQKYDEKGYIKEEVELDYCYENLNSAAELLRDGSSDSLEQAKKCVKAVKNLRIIKGSKNKKIRPKLQFYIS